MTQKEIIKGIEDCIQDAAEYAGNLDCSVEMTNEIEALKLKHLLYVLINKIYKEI